MRGLLKTSKLGLESILQYRFLAETLNLILGTLRRFQDLVAMPLPCGFDKLEVRIADIVMIYVVPMLEESIQVCH